MNNTPWWQGPMGEPQPDPETEPQATQARPDPQPAIAGNPQAGPVPDSATGRASAPGDTGQTVWLPPLGPAGAPYAPVAQPPAQRRSAWRRPAAFAGALILTGTIGVGLGHAVWRPAATSSVAFAPDTQPTAAAPGVGGALPDPSAATAPDATAPGSLPDNLTQPFGGALPFGLSPVDPQGGGGAGGGSAANGSAPNGTTDVGGPTNAAAIASNIDPGVVHINTVIGYGAGEAAGTGMVLTADGLVLTNNHVISGATKISATDVGNGKTYTATVVGYDRSHDVAVLQLTNASGLKTVTPATTPVKVGAAVVAVGNAGGVGGTPSYAGGVVTRLDQPITAYDASDGSSEKLTGLIETNANLQAGESGGPLVNEQGQVVGMDTAAGSSYRFSNDTNGYAIPIATALDIASQITGGNASSTIHLGDTAMLGVQVAGAQSGNVSSGALVAGVLSGGPADKAGIGAGDVITSVNGHPIVSAQALTTVMLSEKAGASVPIRYVDSAGRTHTVTVTLAAGPPQ
ncbi:MAG: Periplasmic pH-dependent serine endoprotease DegQ [Frankiales bacterium]|nr:Periplasmic pH-dependent serine endoprotease DegQ [Frankiales bacterium]